MTTVEEIEEKIKIISERNTKSDDKFKKHISEQLTKSKYTIEMIPLIITLCILSFGSGLLVGFFI